VPPPPFDTNELRIRDRILRRLARRVAASSADADDAVQEAWLAALERPPRDSRGLLAWLHVVTARIARRILQRDRNRRERERRVARSDVSGSAPDSSEEAGRSEGLAGWLARLPPPYREVLRLRYLEDLSIGEIAARLGRSESTVRSQLKRGLDRIRLLLDGRDGARSRERRPALVALGLRWLLGAGLPAAVLVVLAWTLWGPARLASPSTALAARPAATLEDRLAALEPLPDSATARREPRERLPRAPATEGSPAPGAAVHDAVRGTVRSAEGLPVSGARIWVEAGELDEAEKVLVARGTRVALGTSDADGAFRVPIVARGLFLWAESEAFSPSARFDVDVALRERDGEVAIVLPASSATLRGVVLDPAGDPVPGASVRLDPRREGVLLEEVGKTSAAPQYTTTDGAGSFQLPLHGCARQALLVEAVGQAPFQQFFDRQAVGVELEIRLRAPATLHGLAQDPAGPAAGAAVELHLPGLGRTLRTVVDGSSRFAFTGLPAGEYELTLHGARPGPRSAVARGRLQAGARVDLGPLVLDERASIAGRVARAPELASGARVLLRGRGLQRATLADAEGRFLFNGCPPGSYELLLGSAAEPRWVLDRVASVFPGRLDIELAGRAGRPATLFGSLRGASADLAELSRLELEGSPLVEPLRVELDGERSRFELSGLLPGSYTLLGLYGGRRWPLGTFAVDGHDLALDLQLPRMGSLVVRLRPTAGLDLGGANPSFELRSQGLSNFCKARALPADLEYDPERHELRVPSLLPGPWEIVVRWRTAATETCAFEIVPGAVTEVEVPLERGSHARLQPTLACDPGEAEELLCEVHTEGGGVRVFRRSALLFTGQDPKPWGDVGLGLPLDATHVVLRTPSGGLRGEVRVDRAALVAGGDGPAIPVALERVEGLAPVR